MGFLRQRCLVTALLIFLSLVPTVVPELYEEDPDLPYLYDEDAGVVMEYMPSASTENPLRPNFLYSTNNGPRIVEFYAPWCPHCQNFRDHFVDLSGQMVEASSSVGVDLKVYVISCQVHKTLCRNWGLTTFPQIRLFKAGEITNTGKAVYYNLKPNSVLKHLKIPAVIDVSKVREDRKKLKIREPKEANGAYVRTAVAVLNDAHLSFLFALRNGLFMADGPLPIKARNAFESFLNLLHRTIPPNSSLHSLVSAILDDFDSIAENEANLKVLLTHHPPPKKKWSSGCTHGKKGAGYTCGLWNLFHIVTVGVTEWNKLSNKLSLPDLSMTIGLEEAAVTIRNFVENFFGCEECRKNFMAAFDSCSHDRCTRFNSNATSMSEWMELPLWLFETHNSVNARLLREEGEREEFYPTKQDEINERWPAQENCLDCWRDDGGSVRDLMVEKLKLEYW
jgi:thiol-disulfide isomerase/thioredoxin